MNRPEKRPTMTFARTVPNSWRVVLGVGVAGLLFFLSALHANGASTVDSESAHGRVVYVDLDIGNRGFTVISWVEVQEQESGDPVSVAFVRVERPGDASAGGAVRLGKTISTTNVEIGPNGLAIVTWSGSDGFLRYLMRNPRTKWSAVRKIDGAPSSGGVISIGQDGTVIVADANIKSIEDPDALVQVAVRRPGEGFTPWRTISTSPEIVGFDVGVVAGRKGRGTVAWSGTCPLAGEGNPAYYVDVDAETQTAPVQLKNSKCTVWDLQFQSDRQGRQYLKLGTWQGLRLAVRQPGEPFPESMTSVTNSYTRANGDLAVAADGNMALIWTNQGKNGIPSAYRYATMSAGGTLSKTKTLQGPRMNVDRYRDYRLGSAALPGGKLFNFWTRIGPRQTGANPSHRMGTNTWLPGQPFNRPAYRTPVRTNLVPTIAAVDTALDGSRLIWWGEENNRGRVVNFKYISTPAKTG